MIHIAKRTKFKSYLGSFDPYKVAMPTERVDLNDMALIFEIVNNLNAFRSLPILPFSATDEFSTDLILDDVSGVPLKNGRSGQQKYRVGKDNEGGLNEK